MIVVIRYKQSNSLAFGGIILLIDDIMKYIIKIGVCTKEEFEIKVIKAFSGYSRNNGKEDVIQGGHI